MAHVDWLPEDGTLRHMFHRWPELAAPLTDYTEKLMRGPSPLTPAERELIATVTSATNACHFCTGSHRATAEAMGMDGSVVEAIMDDLDGADIAPALKPILAFVKKLTRTPAKIVQADVDAVFEAGWDAEAFHHAVSICALFNHYNRILDAYGIRMDDSYYAEAGRRMAQEGYTAPVSRYMAGKFD